MRTIRRCCVHLLCAAALAGAAADAGSAQETASDTAQVLYDVALGLEEDGRAELARTLYRLILERYPDSSVAPAARRRLAVRRTARPEEDGRVEAMVWGTLYGLWLGLGVPAALGADDVEPYGVGLLLGGPAGLLAGHAYTNGRFVGEGEVGALTFGGTWGTLQGIGWQQVLELGVRTTRECFPTPSGEQCFDGEEDSFEEILAGGILGGLAGIAASEAIIRRGGDITPGTATMVDFGALWGAYYGFSLAELLEADGEDATLTWMLVGGDLGLLVMAVAAPDWNVSRRRARLISIAGVAGLVGGFGLDLLLQPDDDRVAFAIPMLTSIAGLVIGTGATGGEDTGAGERPASPGGALLEWRRGPGLVAGAPLPAVTLAPGIGRASPRDRVGFRLTLLEARF